MYKIYFFSFTYLKCCSLHYISTKIYNVRGMPFLEATDHRVNFGPDYIKNQFLQTTHVLAVWICIYIPYIPYIPSLTADHCEVRLSENWSILHSQETYQFTSKSNCVIPPIIFVENTLLARKVQTQFVCQRLLAFSQGLLPDGPFFNLDPIAASSIKKRRLLKPLAANRMRVYYFAGQTM